MLTRPGLVRTFSAFLMLGSTTFGGMWAATKKLELDLVERKEWLSREQLGSLLLVATLVPAPKFLSLSGLVGFKVGRWPGAVAAVVGLITAPALLVTLGVALVRPELLAGPLAPLNRAIGIAVVGLLFGNAYHQWSGARTDHRGRMIGTALSVVIFATIVSGVPLVLAAILGFALGAVLIRAPADEEPAGGGA